MSSSEVRSDVRGSDMRTDVHRPDIRTDVLSRLHSWRRRLLWQRSWYCVAIAAALFALLRLAGWPDGHSAMQAFSGPPVGLLAGLFVSLLVGVLVLAFGLLLFSSKWRALTPDNFVLHLNRRFPDFEESAQLLLRKQSDLGVLQRLQQQRCMSVYAHNVSQLEAWQPPVRYRNLLLITLAAALLALFAPRIRAFAAQMVFLHETQSQSLSQQSGSNAGLKGVSISVTPPKYTGLPVTESATMDLDVFEGSNIEWKLAFSGDADSYAIEFSDGDQLVMQNIAGSWQAATRAVNTDLYKIATVRAGQTTYPGDIYALTVQLDQTPDIRIIKPTVSTLEIPKSGPAVFDSEVLVSDDYAINGVDIIASVAKGSGEGVKFRDQKLAFDQSASTDKGELYQRHWDLAALGMEPGDEVYFSVIATDNKYPEANTSRSTTLIIRWLEDERPGLAADGLTIDFIPEFFKSQRQIIIDTEQLIEDKPDLEQQSFKDTSYAIGQAQADLKQKYGQYLGDEFDEGSSEEMAPADSHAHVDSGVTISTATNIGDIVKLFGHDHGAAEIGKISKQSPVALMKRAVGEMWAAEKHLLQAEPELALPFEYEAYKFLKLARQADRIYVKRLGFEPPPVSEDARLTGELKDIRSYSLQQQFDPQRLAPVRAQQSLLRQVWQLLSSSSSDVPVDADQDELLAQTSALFKFLSQQRPALIKQAASIEKLRVNKHWQLNNCQDCMQELEQSIWSLLDSGDAVLQRPRAIYSSDDGLIQDYQLELHSRSGARQSAPADDSQQP